MATVGASVAALVNTALGGSVLVMPFVFKSAGIIPSLALLLFVRFVTLASFDLLLFCGARCGKGSGMATKASFHSIAQSIVQRRGHKSTRLVTATNAVMLLSSFGIVLAYQAILADIVTSAVFESPNDERSVEQMITTLTGTNPNIKVKSRSAVIFFTQPFLLGLSFAEKMDSLKILNYVGAIAISCIVAALCWRSFLSISETPILLALGDCATYVSKITAPCVSMMPSDVLGVFSSMNVVAAAFTCHMNIFSIHSELHNPSKERFRTVCSHAMNIVFAVYAASGVTGYALFGAGTLGNVLSNFDSGDVMISLCRFLIVVMSISSVPGVVFPCVKALDAQMLPGKHRKVKVAFVVLSSMLVALIVEDVSTVFVVVGGTTGSLLSFVLPGYFYLALSDFASPSDVEGAPSARQSAHPRRSQARAIFCFGCAILIISNGLFVWERL